MSLLTFISVYIENGAAQVAQDWEREREQSAAFVAGEEGAILFFFEKYQGPLFTFIRRSVNDRDTAADLVQETFRRLIEKRDRIKADKGVRNYMYTIAVNLCTDLFRKQGRIVGSTDDNLLETCTLQGGRPTEDGRKLELHEMEEQLEVCIDRLPQRERTVLLLRKVNGLPLEDVAAVIGTSKRTVQRLLGTAVDKLLVDMERFGYAKDGELVW